MSPPAATVARKPDTGHTCLRIRFRLRRKICESGGNHGAIDPQLHMAYGKRSAHPVSGWRRRLRNIIFESDTPAGNRFDVLLIASIILSVLTVMLDSIAAVRETHGDLLYGLEWFFTLLFTIEYIMRLICVDRPWRYASSFFGIVDLLAIIPTYISLFLPGSQYLVVIRILRVLRVFRVLKLVQYLEAAGMLVEAIRASGRKITVFLVAVATAVVILGSLMYIIEDPETGFTSIPRSIYWAIVTLTTVGYGDISPGTVPGQTLAAVVMVLGYSIIAVPSGLLSVEIFQATKGRPAARSCSGCNAKTLEADANYCRRCGTKL